MLVYVLWGKVYKYSALNYYFQHSRRHKTDNSYPKDSILKLNRTQQTMILRLPTGHCRQKNPFTWTEAWSAPVCRCQNHLQTQEHILQTWTFYRDLRSKPKPGLKKTGTHEKVILTVGFKETTCLLVYIAEHMKLNTKETLFQQFR